MSGFDTLPDEIILKIFDSVSHISYNTISLFRLVSFSYLQFFPSGGNARVTRLGVIRLVSRRLSGIVTPILLLHFCVTAGARPSLKHCTEIQTALVGKTPAIFQHLKKLILTTSITMFNKRESGPWFSLMEVLIPTLGNLSDLS
jgi:hypothetical protein